MIILLCLILLFLKRMLLVVYAINEFRASCTDSYVYCMCNLWVCVFVCEYVCVYHWCHVNIMIKSPLPPLFILLAHLILCSNKKLFCKIFPHSSEFCFVWVTNDTFICVCQVNIWYLICPSYHTLSFLTTILHWHGFICLKINVLRKCD